MKNQLKNLSKTLIASAALALVAGSAFAEAYSITGTVVAATCTLKFFANGSAVSGASFIMPSSPSTAELGTTVGFPTSSNTGWNIVIKAQTATNGVCVSTGVGSTTFNTTWTATGTPFATTSGQKAGNTATATPATNVTIDLLPVGSATRALTGLDLAGANSAAQHGLSNALLATGQTFTARYFKPNTTVATAGAVSVDYTVTAAYQ
jgi:hypothetical protein